MKYPEGGDDVAAIHQSSYEKNTFGNTIVANFDLGLPFCNVRGQMKWR